VELMVLARITFMKAMQKVMFVLYSEYSTIHHTPPCILVSSHHTPQVPHLAVKFLFNISVALSRSYSESMAQMQHRYM
jgi:hypothetical protein